MKIPGDKHAARSYLLFYLFFWASIAAVSPFLALRYEQLNFSGREIGFLVAIPPFVVFLGATGLSWVSDLAMHRGRIVIISLLAVLGSVMFLAASHSLALIAVAVLAYSISSAPINPVVDNAVGEFLSGAKADYGRIRIGGSIGWGSGALLSGIVSGMFGPDAIFAVFAMLMVACVVSARRIPLYEGGQKRGPEFQVFRLLCSFDLCMLLLKVLIYGVCEATIVIFLFLHIHSLGGSRALMGAASIAGVGGEALCFLVTGKVQASIGASRMILVSLIIQGLRMLAISVLVDPALVVPVQFIGGTGFALVWAAGMAEVKRIVPRGLGATGQGLRTGVQMGLGGVIAATVGGFVIESHGSAMIYRYASVLALGSILLAMIAAISRHVGSHVETL